MKSMYSPADHFKNLVTDYYLEVLDRAPEPGGAEYWAAEIERMVSLDIDIREGVHCLGQILLRFSRVPQR